MFRSVKPSRATVHRTVAFNYLSLFSGTKNKRRAKALLLFCGPSGETRTRGILLPNNWWNFFLTFSVLFWHLLFRKSCSLELSSPLSPCTPHPVMVKYVVKNRFPQNSGSGSFIQRICSKQYCQGDCIICCTQVVNAFSCSGRMAQK